MSWLMVISPLKWFDKLTMSGLGITFARVRVRVDLSLGERCGGTRRRPATVWHVVLYGESSV